MASKAGAEVLPALSSMSTTMMMPFLYQTKTLSILSWTASPIYRFRLTHGNRRTFHSTARQLLPSRPNHSYEKRQPSRKKEDNLDEIPFEFNPSQSGLSSAKLESRHSNRWQTNLNEFGETYDGEFGEAEMTTEESEDIMEGEEDGLDSMNLRGPRESTITDTERRAFQKIFSDMFSQNQTASSAPVTSASTSPRDNPAKSKLDSILSSALANNTRTRHEKELVVNRYPPALRSSIAKAIGLYEDEWNNEPSDEDMEVLEEEDFDQLETLRDPERIRIEALMKDAPNDVELWKVMEKEVFSLIPKLGLQEAPLITSITQSKKLKSKGSKKSKAKVETKENVKLVQNFDQIMSDSGTGTNVSSLTLYGPLYPSCLLLGIRLLDRSFAKPSPLSLSILPKIKSLGSISHVLGATTQLYNEILRVYFYRYEDLRAVAKTLNEMEKSAVELDAETLEIIIDILKMKARVKRGERGPVVQALWNMPPFAIANFSLWRHKIASQLAEQHQMNNMASQEY